MKLRTKFTLLTSILVIFIILCIDIFIYFLFIQMATRNEIELLRNKSEQIIEKIGPSDMLDANQNGQILSFLPEDSAMRIFTPELRVIRVYQQEPDIDFNQIVISSMNDSRLLDINDQKILVVRIPIQSDNKIIGVLEIAEKMESLEANINLLMIILFFATFGAVLLSVGGALILSRTLFKPITDSMITMKEIEKSLVFKKIPTQGRSNDELLQMSVTFNRMMERLEENFHKQQQFVSDASHELNTTVTIIEGYANMLRRWGTRDQKIQSESVEAIYEESKQLRKMTRQLLDLASSQKNDNIVFEKFDLLACCRQVSLLAKQLHKHDIRLHSDFQKVEIEADLSKLKQLLLILIDNALKYSERSIDVYVTKKAANAVIRVKDYGIGIPQEDIENVFERFFRVDSSRNRKTGGTGLGLPIAQSIVSEHHGKIRIESAIGAGTEVILHLPLGQKDVD